MNSATATTIAAGSIDAPADDKPPQKKNAASRFRSRRKRISHPLLDSAAPSTPTPKTATEYDATPPRKNSRQHMPITPEPPALVDALKMAARPSTAPSVPDAELPRSSYTSSIDAMAAHVEASRSIASVRTKKRSNKKGDLKLKKRSSGSGSVTSSRSRSSRKSSTRAPSQAGSRKLSTAAATPQRKKIWLIAIPILLAFLVCETFLWLLVFRFKDASEMVIGSHDIPTSEVSMNKGDTVLQEDIVEGVKETIEVSEMTIADDDVDSSSVEDDVAQDVTQQEESHEEEPQAVETSIEPNGELLRLHSMLEEGFSKLRGSVLESDEESNRKSVESLCGNVWVAANEILSSESLHSSGGGRSGKNTEPVGSFGEMTLEELSQSASSSWKYLALDAQHCLGGAGIAFLTKGGVDIDRLRVSTKVFDRLSYVEPHNPDVRAGLGTSLLMQGIFINDNVDFTDKEAYDAQRSLLALASYHLKVASSLCSSPQRATVGDISTPGDMAPAPSRLTRIDDENAASHAAILHNLALAYLTLGDTDSSIPILLRAAAICREHPIDIKPYWNAPNSVLQAAEERALLIAAKLKKLEPMKKKKRDRAFIDLPLLRGD